MLAYTSFKPAHSNAAIINSSLFLQLNSDAFQAHVSALEDDPRALARLTINLLGHIALEPTDGGNIGDILSDKGSDFSPVFGNGDGNDVWVSLSFYKLSNFVGSFVLSRAAPEFELLRNAIQANFSSKMYKAAEMHRRMEQLVTRRMRKIGDKSSSAYQKAMQAVLDQENPQPAKGWVRPNENTLERAYAAGRSASIQRMEPLRDRMFARMAAIEAHTAHPDYQGSFEEIKTAFAMQYLVHGLAGVTLQ